MGKYKATAEAKRAERTVPICLRGDLVADWEAADRELKRAADENRSADSKEGAGLGALVEKVRALEAQMLEHSENWRLRALPRHEFRALVAAHPPRLGEDQMPIPEDRPGINRDTFPSALIRASLVEPELDDEDAVWLLGHTDEQRAQLQAEGKADEIEDGVLNDKQFTDLEDAAWFLNRGDVKVPFSHAASLATRDSEGE
jgi:hypothetical protein